MQAVALSTVHYNHENSGERLVAVAKGSVVEGKTHHGVFSGLSSKDFVQLEKLGAVRAPTKSDLALVGDDEDLEDEPAPAPEPEVAAEPAAEPAPKKGKAAAKAEDEDMGL